MKKRGNRDLYARIGMIPSCKEVEILGVTFQMWQQIFTAREERTY